MAALFALLGVPDSDGEPPHITPTHPPRYSHVAVLVLENHEYRSIIGSPASPFLASLARRSAISTSYYGVTHPSLPNYMAMTGGSTFGISNNCRSCKVEGKSIFDQLSLAGIHWKAYFEPASRRVNPFLHYEGSLSGGDSAGVVPFSRLRNDINHRSLPRFSWLGLSLCHDGHNCSAGVSDRYLSRLVPSVLRALGPRGVLFVTWDEGTSNAGPIRPARRRPCGADRGGRRRPLRCPLQPTRQPLHALAHDRERLRPAAASRSGPRTDLAGAAAA